MLRGVADAESIEIADEALALIARAATGSFRDALGTLEQLTTYSGSAVALDDVLAVLGVADADLLFEVVAAVTAHDERRVLVAVARLSESGRDVGQFYRDLEAHLRQLLVVQTLGKVPESLRLTAEHDARVAEQATQVSAGDLVRALDNLAAALSARSRTAPTPASSSSSRSSRRPRRGWTPPRARCWLASSSSRRAVRRGPGPGAASGERARQRPRSHRTRLGGARGEAPQGRPP